MVSAKLLVALCAALMLSATPGAQATLGGRRYAAGGAGLGSMAGAMAGASAGATAGAAASADAESEGLAALGSGSYCDQSWLAAHPWFSAWLQQWQGVCKHLGGCKLLTPCPTPKPPTTPPTEVPTAPPAVVSGPRADAAAEAAADATAGAGSVADAGAAANAGAAADASARSAAAAEADADATAGAGAAADSQAASFASALTDGSRCNPEWMAGNAWFGPMMQQWLGICKHFGVCKHLKPCPPTKPPTKVPAAPPTKVPAAPPTPPTVPPAVVSGPRETETAPPTPPPVPTATTAESQASAEAEAEAEAGAQATTETTTTGACKTIADLAAADPDLTTLAAAAQAVGIGAQLADPELVATILAPTNAAFTASAALSALGLTAAQALSAENLPILKTVLSYHVIPGVAAKSTDLTDGQELPTLNAGQTITVDLSSGAPVFKPSLASGSDANVVAADIVACSAIIHKIDAVLLPANAVVEEGAGAAATADAAATAEAGAAPEEATPTTTEEEATPTTTGTDAEIPTLAGPGTDGAEASTTEASTMTTGGGMAGADAMAAGRK